MTVSQLLRFTLLLTLSALAAACSSGGNSGSPSDTTQQYTVDTSINDGGTIRPDRLQLAEGASATFALSPRDGFTIVAVTGCGGQLEGNTYSINSISGDCTVAVEFALTGGASPPSAPLLQVRAAPTKTLHFHWRDSAAAASYTLLENLGDGSGYAEVATLDANATSFDRLVFLPSSIDASYILQACNNAGCSDSAALYVEDNINAAVGYFKAPVAGNHAAGWSVALSADGLTMAVGAPEDASASTGIDVPPDPSSPGVPSSGAVHVFSLAEGKWAQQAYVKAEYTGAQDRFGASAALSADGNTLVVGAIGEASALTGINGNPLNDNAPRSGAAYVFTRTANGWMQQAYIKAPSAAAGDLFGHAVAVSADGNTVAVGAYGGDKAFVFTRSRNNWQLEAELTGANTEFGDNFGHSIGLSADGATLAVGAFSEGGHSSSSNNPLPESGAVYIFSRGGSAWTQQAYIKAATPSINSHFGWSLALAGDGSALAVGARAESSGATGIDGDATADSLNLSGAAYVFVRSGRSWQQQAYIKASNTAENALFGHSVAISAVGDILAVGAVAEASDAHGVLASATQARALASGGAYVFKREGNTWRQQAFIKAPSTHDAGQFSASLALNGPGSTLAVGASSETSPATGINGDTANSSTREANRGAVYLY